MNLLRQSILFTLVSVFLASSVVADVNKYEKIWYSNEKMSADPCNAKATSYCSNMSGSFIANSTKNIVMKQPYFKEITFNFSTLILDKKKLVS